MATIDNIRQTAGALKNLPSFVLERIRAEAKSEHERILFEGLYQSDPATNERMNAHYGRQLMQLLKNDTAALQEQATGLKASAQASYDAARRSWEGAVNRAEYSYQSDRIQARVKTMRTPAEAKALVADAKTREQLEALADAMPDMAARFTDLMQRAEIHSLAGDVGRRLDALRPASYTDAITRLENANNNMLVVARALEHANNDTGGALDNELGNSIFSTTEGVQWSQQVVEAAGIEAPAGIFG